jgi:hypothetical protein
MMSQCKKQDVPPKNLFESTSKSGFQTNRDLLKSTCLSIFNRNDPENTMCRQTMDKNRAMSFRSSVTRVEQHDFRPILLERNSLSSAMLARLT